MVHTWLLGWMWKKRRGKKIYVTVWGDILQCIKSNNEAINYTEIINNKLQSDRETDGSSETNGFGTFPDHHCANSPNDITESEYIKSFMIRVWLPCPCFSFHLSLFSLPCFLGLMQRCLGQTSAPQKREIAV